MWRRGMGARGSARVFGCFRSSHVPGHPVRAVPLAAFIPSRVPAVAGEHGAGPRQAVRRGQSRGRLRPRSAAAGQNERRPRARPGGPAARSCCRGRCGRRWSGGRGQAADLPVAHAIEDQGEQLAGGGDLGDVLGLAPAPTGGGADPCPRPAWPSYAASIGASLLPGGDGRFATSSIRQGVGGSGPSSHHVLSLWISGLNPRTGWAYGIASQSVWIAYGLLTHQPGMIALSGAYTGLYGRNI
jgi:hypothetical protein